MRHCESETPVTDIFPEIILLSKKSICLPTKAKLKLKIKIFAYTPTLSKKLGYEIKFFKKLCLGSYSLQILSSNLPQYIQNNTEPTSYIFNMMNELTQNSFSYKKSYYFILSNILAMQMFWRKSVKDIKNSTIWRKVLIFCFNLFFLYISFLF